MPPQPDKRLHIEDDGSIQRYHWFDLKRWRLVGETNGLRFWKSVRGSDHFLRVPPGCAIQEGVYADLQWRNVRDIDVYDLETSITHHSEMTTWARHAFYVYRDEESGPQWGLHDQFWLPRLYPAPPSNQLTLEVDL